MAKLTKSLENFNYVNKNGTHIHTHCAVEHLNIKANILKHPKHVPLLRLVAAYHSIDFQLAHAK